MRHTLGSRMAGVMVSSKSRPDRSQLKPLKTDRHQVIIIHAFHKQHNINLIFVTTIIIKATYTFGHTMV